MKKREKNIVVGRSYRTIQDEQNVKNALEQAGLASWIPTLSKFRVGVSKLAQTSPLIQPQIDLSDIRSLLTNEKSKLLHLIRTKKPASIYALAKLSGRDFKSIRQDLTLFEKFGLIKLIQERTKEREKLKPVLQVDKLNISISI